MRNFFDFNYISKLRLAMTLIFTFFSTVVFYRISAYGPSVAAERNYVFAYLMSCLIFALYIVSIRVGNLAFDKQFKFSLIMGLTILSFTFLVSLLFLFFIISALGIKFINVSHILPTIFFSICFFLAIHFVNRESLIIHFFGEGGASYSQQAAYDEEDSSLNEREKAYLILDLPLGCDDERVKVRFRELSMLYHPDRLANLSDKQKKVAEQEFNRLKKARDIILASK